MSSRKYLMWGVIPVQFNDLGAWKTCTKSKIANATLTAVAMTLLHLNRAAERIIFQLIKFPVPMVPSEEAWWMPLQKQCSNKG